MIMQWRYTSVTFHASGPFRAKNYMKPHFLPFAQLIAFPVKDLFLV